MDQYSSPYTSIIPRLLPTQYSAKRIPMVEEGYQYVDTHPTMSRVSPSATSFQPLSTRTQLMNNELNYQDNPLSNQVFPSNNFDNLSKGRTKSRFHLEALKDNSGDVLPRNSYSAYSYPPNDNRGYEHFKPNSSQQNHQNNYPIVFLIIFAIFIGLFAITALAISIYLLVKMSST